MSLLTEGNFKRAATNEGEEVTLARAGNYNAGMMAAAARLPFEAIVAAGGALEFAKAAWKGDFSQAGPAILFFEDVEDVRDELTGFQCY